VAGGWWLVGANMTIKSYKDLKVWQVAIDMVVDIYKLTGKFPRNESFGLASQIQRAMVSIPSNIAEGHARGTSREFHHFLSITLGSTAELETQLIIAAKLDYLELTTANEMLERVDKLGKMIRALQKSVKTGCQ
jgi:four helix bundle protein